MAKPTKEFVDQNKNANASWMADADLTLGRIMGHILHCATRTNLPTTRFSLRWAARHGKHEWVCRITDTDVRIQVHADSPIDALDRATHFYLADHEDATEPNP